MNRLTTTGLAVGLALASLTALADGGSASPPEVLLKQDLSGMPTGATQEIRVLTARLGPGENSVFHTHRAPVTTYVLEGALTLDLEGHDPVIVNAGEAYIEPANTPVTARNESTTDYMRVAIFYVSDPDTPFLDPINQ